MAKKKKPTKKSVETLKHADAKRTNIPTAEFESVMGKHQSKPVPVAYPRPGANAADAITAETADRDLDPQLVWRGKDQKGWSDLVVQAPPLFIQEKVHPKVLVDDLRRRTEAAEIARQLADPSRGLTSAATQADLFADFNGIPDHSDAKTEFYQHDQHWSNRMILGDSLQVMASLAEREGLRGKVQCIYLDPPYGIKFNSNFQWSTTSRDVKDGDRGHITREPEQVKAFRDTWRDGIHSYLTYLRDRLTAARDLLHDTGSIFVQIGDENVHRVRAVMDEVFGDENQIVTINLKKKGNQKGQLLESITDYILFYAKDKQKVKFRDVYNPRPQSESGYVSDQLTSGGLRRNQNYDYQTRGRKFKPASGNCWKILEHGMERVEKAERMLVGPGQIRFKKFDTDFGLTRATNYWDEFGGATGAVYVVQTATKVVQRCLLMATDPGDLVLDPTCGSGTTAYVAEQWGRRWITIDTSRVSLTLARARIMGARYPYYLLADSEEGRAKEAAVRGVGVADDPHKAATAGRAPSYAPGEGSATSGRGFVRGSVRQGFVYERVPHITLKSIANNAEIDVIWETYQGRLEPLRERLNAELGTDWQDREIPRAWEDAIRRSRGCQSVGRDAGKGSSALDAPGRRVDTRGSDDTRGSAEVRDLHARWWEQRILRQKAIDASIAAKAEFEYLYDKPYEDKKKVRVAGPFTVESLSPHRALGVDENDDLIDPLKQKGLRGQGAEGSSDGGDPFLKMVVENLKTAGVQQAHKEDKIEFTSIAPWPGEYIGAEGRYVEERAEGSRVKGAEGKPGEAAEASEKRAGIFIGPEFGTVSRQDLVLAAREAGDAGFDALIACAFNYEAHASEFKKLGALPILKARMNADLHMADDLKNTGKGNLFVIFGEPDIDVLPPEDAPPEAEVADFDTLRVRINGVDVFHPSTGEVRSDDADGIACWFIDTDYNEESFFVRQAYFLGANDPYKSLKTTLKAEIDREAWESLHSDVSREFPKPKGGRIAVKVINHLGDEGMKVFRVE